MASGVLKAVGGLGIVAFIFTPFRTSDEVLINIVGLIVGIVSLGAAKLLDLELEPKTPPGSKHDPSRPLGL